MPSAFERKQAAQRQARMRVALFAGVGVMFLAGAGLFVFAGGAQQPSGAAVPAVQSQPVVQPVQPVQPVRTLQPTPTPQPVQASLPLAEQPARSLSAAQVTDGFAPLLNAARATGGLGPVVANARLAQAALAHARDMEARDFFDHVAPDGGTLVDRVSATGYRYCVVAENIARGQRSLREVHEGWMNSPGHRANNLLPEITEFGLVLEDDTWVLVLGKSGC